MSDFWNNKANEFGSGNRRQPNNPPPNTPPNNDSWNQNGGNNNVPPWDNGNNQNRNPWDNGGNNNGGGNTRTTTAPPGTLAKTFMSSVFSFMFAALAVTGIVAAIVGYNADLMTTLHGGPIHYVLMFAPLIVLFVMMGRFHKMSAGTMMFWYFSFATLMGLSLATVFVVYTGTSIASTFFITAATFGVMAFLGYTTKVDLTRFGGILIMALVGIIIASVVNFFMQSEAMHFLISIIGVLIFTGLTAYDVQKLKRIGEGIQYGGGTTQKLAMMGAVTLYLDFINLFLFLLRLLGNRN